MDVLDRFAGRGSGCSNRCLGGGRRRFFWRGSGRCGRSGSRLCRSSRVAFDFQFEQLVAFFQAVAELHFHAFDDTGFRRRDFHACLVRLQRQDALIGFDTIADLDHQLNDFTFTVADVGYSN